METEDYLTIQEAATELQVSDAAIRAAILEGRLPHVEKYGRKLISRADLDAYRQRTRPSGEKPKGRPRKMEEAVTPRSKGNIA